MFRRKSTRFFPVKEDPISEGHSHLGKQIEKFRSSSPCIKMAEKHGGVPINLKPLPNILALQQSCMS